jgi:hypothetical protein
MGVIAWSVSAAPELARFTRPRPLVAPAQEGTRAFARPDGHIASQHCIHSPPGEQVASASPVGAPSGAMLFHEI